MTPSVLTRHPRYSLLLLLVLCSVAWLLIPGGPGPHGPGMMGSLRDYRWGGRSLTDVVRAEEEKYQDMLRDREVMVKKWGPTAKDVVAFPPKDDFYTLWDFFIPAYNCPHHVERVGTMGDGGKWVCGLERIAKQSACVIYSFGINGESSFESTLLERAPGCQVWGYDFSVKSFGPEIESDLALAERSHFHSYALGSKNNYALGQWPPTYTLQALMETNGHEWIDILKIDIEGAEFDSLLSFLDYYTPESPRHPHGMHDAFQGPVLPVGQLQIEIHARKDTEYAEFEPFKMWWERLEAAGLRPFWTEANLVYVNLINGARPDLVEYSFMNIRGEHALVSDRFH